MSKAGIKMELFFDTTIWSFYSRTVSTIPTIPEFQTIYPFVLNNRLKFKIILDVLRSFGVTVSFLT